eukprot:1137571-Pelagomonas_calceolata.AAC.2
MEMNLIQNLLFQTRRGVITIGPLSVHWLKRAGARPAAAASSRSRGTERRSLVVPHVLSTHLVGYTKRLLSESTQGHQLIKLGAGQGAQAMSWRALLDGEVDLHALLAALEHGRRVNVVHEVEGVFVV